MLWSMVHIGERPYGDMLHGEVMRRAAGSPHPHVFMGMNEASRMQAPLSGRCGAGVAFMCSSSMLASYTDPRARQAVAPAMCTPGGPPLLPSPDHHARHSQRHEAQVQGGHLGALQEGARRPGFRQCAGSQIQPGSYHHIPHVSLGGVCAYPATSAMLARPCPALDSGEESSAHLSYAAWQTCTYCTQLSPTRPGPTPQPQLAEECWHQDASKRPTMQQVLERIGLLLGMLEQDEAAAAAPAPAASSAAVAAAAGFDRTREGGAQGPAVGGAAAPARPAPTPALPPLPEAAAGPPESRRARPRSGAEVRSSGRSEGSWSMARGGGGGGGSGGGGSGGSGGSGGNGAGGRAAAAPMLAGHVRTPEGTNPGPVARPVVTPPRAALPGGQPRGWRLTVDVGAGAQKE